MFYDSEIEIIIFILSCYKTFIMAQKPTTNIQIFSQDSNYENRKCISISSENAAGDTNRRVVFMTQPHFRNRENRYHGKHTNKNGIPNHVYEGSVAPVRFAITKYDLNSRIDNNICSILLINYCNKC